MERKTFSRGFVEFLDIMGSAIAVASATEAGRRPKPHHLERLGIDPNHYSRIGR
jgi:hypothetical protein